MAAEYIVEKDEYKDAAEDTHIFVENYYTPDRILSKRITNKIISHTLRIETIELFTNNILSSISADIYDNDIHTEGTTLYYFPDTSIVRLNVTTNCLTKVTNIIGYYITGQIRAKIEHRNGVPISKVLYDMNGVSKVRS
jgi:antitoxin component YwqK of YwqJK toxin-antitoxin module